jgi:hypothetical protein
VEKGKPLGFPQHTHANIEIIAYVRDGALSHRDSLGNQGRIAAGDVRVIIADYRQEYHQGLNNNASNSSLKCGLIELLIVVLGRFDSDHPRPCLLPDPYLRRPDATGDGSVQMASALMPGGGRLRATDRSTQLSHSSDVSIHLGTE